LLSIAKNVSKLDPFIGLFLKNLDSNDDQILVNTLTILTNVVKLDLPSMTKEVTTELIVKLFKLLETSSDSDFMNSLFKCTTEFVKYKVEGLKQGYLIRLTEILKVNLSHYHRQPNVFG
jgi:hypothetical protein